MGSGRIVDEIRRELAWDDRLDDSGIRVTGHGSSVRLEGQVPNHGARLAAEADAWSIPGVAGVDNRLLVEPGAGETPDDGQLSEVLSGAISINPSLDGAVIGVTVEDGQVSLRGHVDAYWKRLLAESLASDLVGVRSVVNGIAVVPSGSMRDETIASDITEVIERRRGLELDRVDVTVEDGVVRLKGSVSDWHNHQVLLDLVGRTRGVVGIEDDTTVEH